MENWKQHSDDEGRSFIEFIREQEENFIVCVPCTKQIAEKGDLDAIDKIYTHTRSIEHGFKMFIMLKLDQMEVIDLTNFDDDHRENRSPMPKKQTNIEIKRNTDGSLNIFGFNPIKYVIPIIDLPFMKNKSHQSETSSKTVFTSLDNYVSKSSKRKHSSEHNSSVSSTEKEVTSPKKQKKTLQLTLKRRDKNEVDASSIEPSQNISQQVQSGTNISSSSLLMDGPMRINELRPAKRDISQVIRCRIVIKSDKHPFHNFLGPTTMFTCDLIDESGEIRLSAYGANVDKFYDLVEVDRIYYFSKFKVLLSKTPAISQYNITCTNETIIRPCVLTLPQFPRLKFNFQPISTVEQLKKDDVVDVIAIIEKIGEVENKRLVNGAPGRNRGIWIVDQSQAKILLYVWGTNADNFETNRPGDVIAVKRAKLKTYAKLNLDSSCLSSSTFKINPQLPEAMAVRDWYQSGKYSALKVLSSVPRQKKICESTPLQR